MTFESVDAHLGETAVLAVGFNAHSGLEGKGLRDVGALYAVEEFEVHDIHERGSLPTFGHIAGGRNDNVTQLYFVGLKFHIEQ